MLVDLNHYLCFNLYRGWREISSFYKDALGRDISPQNVYILALCDLKTKVTMNDLSKAMSLDGSAVSTLISRMEKKSLVKRMYSNKDRRCVYVQLTQQGYELKERLEPQIDLLRKNVTNNISKEDIEHLQRIVGKIAENRVNFIYSA